MAQQFDRSQDDVGNIVLLEHVNLRQPDQQLATLFYVVGLQLTRDPYLMVGLDNMWVNVGRNQFHLPTHPEPQTLRGVTGIVVPNLDAVEQSLQRVSADLSGTQFSVSREADCIDAHCPWGNRIRCHQAGSAFGNTELAIAYIEFHVGSGCANGIAEFYRRIIGAPTEVIERDGATTAVVVAGPNQRFYFREVSGPLADYDGHHMQIYLSDFSGPYHWLRERELISMETNEHEWRFVDIVDVDSNDVLFQIEHEVRSTLNPLYDRPMVNRNPQQRNTAYERGKDTFRGSF